ncbi:methyltransferase [Leptospira kirschneri serovar Pomona]|uniref:Methyltransferase n=1 Tax=Leptospira kirschneri serovar Pomona TaxID=561005 RepID=A0A1T1E1N6_9LEPT|nr:methyltransferase domain-containing protein [Leptospira kirschneri]EMK15695.1 methyltransferase domain protein [Leptospira kirschneri serovar Bim str. PUO 1247]EMN05135.1 methyltransferase domain protein [Leptospira kirschneri serovar Bim str. 1051]OOV47016.1 methyltransferase [Leptospira kirschneri serovar Pomona]
MLDEFQKNSIKPYIEMAKEKKIGLTQSAGRYAEDSGKEEFIWKDIQEKLCLVQSDSLLDLGVGFGPLASKVINYCIKEKKTGYFYDIPEVIENLKTEYAAPNIHFLKGFFPYGADEFLNSDITFDSILIYSVIHYTSKPFEFVKEAARKLKTGGRMLIADIPNVDKKGRFLCTENGRKFHAAYKKIPLNDVPIYKNQADFVFKNENQNKVINDQLISKILMEFRAFGYDVYILPQNEDLPFSKTREDILLIRNY